MRDASPPAGAAQAWHKTWHKRGTRRGTRIVHLRQGGFCVQTEILRRPMPSRSVNVTGSEVHGTSALGTSIAAVQIDRGVRGRGARAELHRSGGDAASHGAG